MQAKPPACPPADVHTPAKRTVHSRCPQSLTSPGFSPGAGIEHPKSHTNLQADRMPAPTAITARELVNRFGALARGRQLTAFGFTRRDLADAVTRGEISRIRRGVFATDALSPQVRTAASHGGALTCAGALRLHGIWTLRDDAVAHVWMGAAGREHHVGCSCVAHFRPGRMALGVADVEHALVHAFHCYGEEFFFCAFESAWNKRLLSPSARARIRAALPRTAHWLVDFAHDGAPSGLESLVRLRLHLLGIAVQTQVVLSGVGKVDIVVAGRLIIETDGRANHEAEDKMHRDRVRDAAASALGYETLRFDYDQIIKHWPSVLSAILAALRRNQD